MHLHCLPAPPAGIQPAGTFARGSCRLASAPEPGPTEDLRLAVHLKLRSGLSQVEDLGLSNVPHVSPVECFDPSRQQLVIVASDGVWDVASAERVVQVVTSSAYPVHTMHGCMQHPSCQPGHAQCGDHGVPGSSAAASAQDLNDSKPACIEDACSARWRCPASLALCCAGV